MSIRRRGCCVAAHRRQLTPKSCVIPLTQIYRCLCEEAAASSTRSSAPVASDPREWKEGIVNLAIRFGLERYLYDDDYVKAGLPIPTTSGTKADAAAAAAAATNVTSPQQPKTHPSAVSPSPEPQTPPLPPHQPSHDARPPHAALREPIKTEDEELQVPRHPLPLPPHTSIAQQALPPQHHPFQIDRPRPNQEPCYECYRARQPCLPYASSRCCEHCMWRKLPCNANGYEPAPVRRTPATLTVYRCLMDDSRERNQGSWCPVEPTAAGWQAYGCTTVVHLAYLFGVDAFLTHQDFVESGYRRGLQGISAQDVACLQRLRERLPAHARGSRDGQSGPHRSARAAVGRRSDDASLVPRRSTQQQPDLATSTAYSLAAYAQPLPGAPLRLSDGRYSAASATPFDAAGEPMAIDASRLASGLPSQKRLDCDESRRNSSATALHSSSSNVSSTVTQLPGRLIPYRSLFTSQMSIADPELSDEMASARRFLEEEIPHIVARYNAQAIFSGKPTLANCGQIIDEAIKRQQQGGS